MAEGREGGSRLKVVGRRAEGVEVEGRRWWVKIGLALIVNIEAA